MATTAPAAGHLPQIGFGDRLRRLRLDLGMDLREFGEALEISHATLSRYETASREPRNAKHVASSIQLRFGSSGLDLKRWLLDGASPESTDYWFRRGRGRVFQPRTRPTADSWRADLAAA